MKKNSGFVPKELKKDFMKTQEVSVMKKITSIFYISKECITMQVQMKAKLKYQKH